MPIRRARCGRCQAKSADNTGCCKGERRQWREQRTEAGAAVAECEGLLPPKHDAGTATRHYRAFWQHRCRAAVAGAVLKPSGGNCAVLPLFQMAAGYQVGCCAAPCPTLSFQFSFQICLLCRFSPGTGAGRRYRCGGHVCQSPAGGRQKQSAVPLPQWTGLHR